MRYAQLDGAAPTYYEASVRERWAWPPLDEDRRAGLCGGGDTGLSAALHLAERGFRVVLPGARRIGNGARDPDAARFYPELETALIKGRGAFRRGVAMKT